MYCCFQFMKKLKWIRIVILKTVFCGQEVKVNNFATIQFFINISSVQSRTR